MIPDWFKLKRYPHIGLPMVREQIPASIRKIQDPAFVANYRFLPFIQRIKRVRKFRRPVNDKGIKSKERKAGEKTRLLYYAAQFDYNIYSYYSYLLSQSYENELANQGLNEVVLAYRSIPHPRLGRNQCNIDFAEAVFNSIRDSQAPQLSAIALDITSFFDHLNHKHLKRSWRDIMGFEGSLPADHFHVFKNITRFSFVNEKNLFEQFSDRILIQTPGGKLRNKPVANLKYLRDEGAVAFCSKPDFFELTETVFIDGNKFVRDKDGSKVPRTCGIPQGSPISATLANLYLLEFDIKVNEYVTRLGGHYFRYSDDLLVLVSTKYEAEVKHNLIEWIKAYKLTINVDKTQEFRFELLDGGGRSCSQVKGDRIVPNAALQYLGFEFDGRYTRIRSQSLSQFYRKMKRSMRRGRYYASEINNSTNGKIFKRRLYKRFTHLGADRKRVFKRSKVDPSKFERSDKFNWGNFLTYALMADRIMRNSKIKPQLKRAWPNFHKFLKVMENTVWPPGSGRTRK